MRQGYCSDFCRASSAARFCASLLGFCLFLRDFSLAFGLVLLGAALAGQTVVSGNRTHGFLGLTLDVLYDAFDSLAGTALVIWHVDPPIRFGLLLRDPTQVGIPHRRPYPVEIRINIRAPTRRNAYKKRPPRGVPFTLVCYSVLMSQLQTDPPVGGTLSTIRALAPNLAPSERRVSNISNSRQHSQKLFTGHRNWRDSFQKGKRSVVVAVG